MHLKNQIDQYQYFSSLKTEDPEVFKPYFMDLKKKYSQAMTALIEGVSAMKATSPENLEPINQWLEKWNVL